MLSSTSFVASACSFDHPFSPPRGEADFRNRMFDQSGDKARYTSLKFAVVVSSVDLRREVGEQFDTLERRS